MLSTYDRVMNSGPRVTRTGSVTVDNRSEHDLVAQLQAEVEALRRRVKELIGKAAIIALFSLTFSACATQAQYVYDVRTCPAPLTASGCAQWLGSK